MYTKLIAFSDRWVVGSGMHAVMGLDIIVWEYEIRKLIIDFVVGAAASKLLLFVLG